MLHCLLTPGSLRWMVIHYPSYRVFLKVRPRGVRIALLEPCQGFRTKAKIRLRNRLQTYVIDLVVSLS